MRLVLKPHPDHAPAAVASIEVEVSRPQANLLRLDYAVMGDIGALLIPPPATSVRTDGLWQHTCLEAFVRPASGGGYAEYNFSPSGKWAAYAFAGYREGMAALDAAPLDIELRSAGDLLGLRTSVAVPEGPLRLALSAVIEETSGRKSYWALAHPVAKPDFHHPDSFVHEL